MTRRSRLLATVVAAATTLGASALVHAASGPSTSIAITIRHSHFDPSAISVPAGVPVTIVIRNTDPIDHEWIAGDEALHERHRTGTEPYHDTRPTEVTIPALETRTTVVTFPVASGWTFACHLPGHEAYGMVGSVTIALP
jgi:uncharacterized cupredoxin-like copper-binding protein